MKQQTKIALAGGGGAKDSCLLDKVFASWIGPNGRLLYLPVALRGMRSYESCLEWITTTFAPFNITRITMWTDLAEHRMNELEEFDAIYIGGGNTYSLLAQLIDSNFHRHLTAYAHGGGVVYGGSAGAVVLGKDIRTVNHLDRNDIGLLEVECLNLANNHAIWAHYQPREDKLIEEFVQKHQQPVLAISERSGVIIESGGIRTVGFEPSYRFDNQGKFEV
ncbi:MAG: Type 1 glutamine amidotransferase-like domain-containing protein [Anaerolineales bacterium]